MINNNNNNFSKIKEYSRNMFDANGNLLPFSEQILSLLHGELRKRDILIMDINSKLPFKNFNEMGPLVINQGITKKVFDKHGLSIKTLIHIPEKIKTSPLAIESKFNNLLVFLDVIGDNLRKPDLMCVININHNNQQSLRITEIRSIYFDNVIDELKNAKTFGNKIYTNKYTKKWLALRLTSQGQLGTSHTNNMIAELSKNASKLNINS